MKLKKTMAVLLAAAMLFSTAALISGCAKTAEPAETETEESMEPEYLFDKGVWSASIDGEIDTYFVFYDQKSGRTEKADGTGGVPFTCEQEGTNAVFHFGSADDETKASFSLGENTGTFAYESGSVVYFFEFVPDADPDNFSVPVK